MGVHTNKCTQTHTYTQHHDTHALIAAPVDGRFEDVTSTILNDIDLDTDEQTTATDDEPMTDDNNNQLI